MRVTAQKLSRYVDNAAKSNVARSTRRFFFNYLNESVADRGYFHVDQMYGLGSGVLLKINEKFFILTANHVVQNNTLGNFQNESPFWFAIKDNKNVSGMRDFLYPKRIWFIGELISKISSDVDQSDVLLIELFQPQEFNMPNHYIEIIDTQSVLTKDELFDGQILLVSGYPFERNYFDSDSKIEGFDHATNVQRHTVPGVHKKPKA